MGARKEAEVDRNLPDLVQAASVGGHDRDERGRRAEGDGADGAPGGEGDNRDITNWER